MCIRDSFYADACSSCGRQTLYVAGAPLSVIGVGIYFALLAWLLVRPRSILLFVVAVATLGAHLAILTSFSVNQPCFYCWGAFLFLLVASLLLARSTPGALTTGTVCLAVSLAAGSLTIHRTSAFQYVSPLAQALAREAANDPSLDSRNINVIVYESLSCGLCRRFNEEYEPRLAAGARRPVRFFHRYATNVPAVPTIIIVGLPQGIYTGLPPYEELRSVFAKQ